jgi:hypothetical protein
MEKPTKPTSWIRNAVKKLSLILFSTLFGLAICEAGLRLLGHKYGGSTLRNDPLLGWSLRPGSGAWEVDEGFAWGKINSQGYRDRERTVNKPHGVYRVAVLGDSFTEARQVDLEKTFVSLAEEELNRRRCFGEHRVEVLNFGIGGFGTGQELLLLRERVWKFNPDLVVLQFYASNDLYNNSRKLNISSPDKAPYFLFKNGKLELDESFRQGRAFDPAYIKFKGIAADVMNNIVLLQLAYKLSRVQSQREELARMNGEGGARTQSDPDVPPPQYQKFLSFMPPRIPSMVEAWRVTEALVVEFDKEVRDHQTTWLMMIVPADAQINPDSKKQEAYRTKYNVESLEYADDRIEQFARANGISVLRLTTSLIEEARRTGTYMAGFANTDPNAGHFNERGHAVVARELVQALCGISAVKVTANVGIRDSNEQPLNIPTSGVPDKH